MCQMRWSALKGYEPAGLDFVFLGVESPAFDDPALGLGQDDAHAQVIGKLGLVPGYGRYVDMKSPENKPGQDVGQVGPGIHRNFCNDHPCALGHGDKGNWARRELLKTNSDHVGRFDFSFDSSALTITVSETSIVAME